MADSLPNGTADSADVEMKEEMPAEQSLSNIQRAGYQDPTDPNPPPQEQSSSVVPVISGQPPDFLASIAPAVATPPTAARPSSIPPQPAARPEKPVAHGGPTRQFLNSNLTPHLLEGMKYLAVYEPEKPLLWLSEFLRNRSKEVEGP